MSDINFWRTVTISTAAVGQTLFIGLYVTFPWWRSFLGRALFGKAVVLLVLVDFAALSRLFGFGGVDRIFVVLYGLLALGIWVQFFAFLRVRLQHRENAVSGNSEVRQ